MFVYFYYINDGADYEDERCKWSSL